MSYELDKFLIESSLEFLYEEDSESTNKNFISESMLINSLSPKDVNTYDMMVPGLPVENIPDTICVSKSSNSAITITSGILLQVWDMKARKGYSLVIDKNSSSILKRALK